MAVNKCTVFFVCFLFNVVHITDGLKSGTFNISFSQARSNVCLKKAPCKNNGRCYLPYKANGVVPTAEFVCACVGPYVGKDCGSTMRPCQSTKAVGNNKCLNFTGVIVCTDGVKPCMLKKQDFSYWERLRKKNILNPCESADAIFINMECETINAKCFPFHSGHQTLGICACRAGFDQEKLCRQKIKAITTDMTRTNNCMQTDVGVFCRFNRKWKRMLVAEDMADESVVDMLRPRPTFPKVIIEVTEIPLSGGETDDTDDDPCESTNPCLHGGICRPHPLKPYETFQCACALGRSGTTCEKELSGCKKLICVRLGDCVVAPKGAVCVCQNDAGGQLCQLDMKHGQSNWLTLVLLPNDLKTLEIVLGCVAAVLVCVMIGLTVHCCQVMQKSMTLREEHEQALRRGITITELPPDMTEISRDMCGQYFCCCKFLDKKSVYKEISTPSSDSDESSDEHSDIPSKPLNRTSNSRSRPPTSHYKRTSNSVPSPSTSQCNRTFNSRRLTATSHCNRSSNSRCLTSASHWDRRHSPVDSDSSTDNGSSVSGVITGVQAPVHNSRKSSARKYIRNGRFVVPAQPKFSTVRIYPNVKERSLMA